MNGTIEFMIGRTHPMSEKRPFVGRNCKGDNLFAHVRTDVVGRHLLETPSSDLAIIADKISFSHSWVDHKINRVAKITGISGFLTPTNLIKVSEMLVEVAKEMQAIEKHTDEYDKI